MKVYTSYFGKLGVLLKNGIFPICIARGVPKFYGGAKEQSVAPFGWMIKGDISREEYIRAYQEKVLSRVDPNIFLLQIEKLSGGKDVALLCYEKPTDFCHRHLLAEWLENETGIEVKEFGVEGTPWNPKNPPVVQKSIFDDF
ncbi:MAG: DUF488 domain-containing protein [Bacteroides sp.]|nr:DUF488 domain-containing protein [Bacteroides sp.]